jgi:hypothetical protein
MQFRIVTEIAETGSMAVLLRRKRLIWAMFAHVRDLVIVASDDGGNESDSAYRFAYGSGAEWGGHSCVPCPEAMWLVADTSVRAEILDGDCECGRHAAAARGRRRP